MWRKESKREKGDASLLFYAQASSTPLDQQNLKPEFQRRWRQDSGHGHLLPWTQPPAEDGLGSGVWQLSASPWAWLIGPLTLTCLPFSPRIPQPALYHTPLAVGPPGTLALCSAGPVLSTRDRTRSLLSIPNWGHPQKVTALAPCLAPSACKPLFIRQFPRT